MAKMIHSDVIHYAIWIWIHVRLWLTYPGGSRAPSVLPGLLCSILNNYDLQDPERFCGLIPSS